MFKTFLIFWFALCSSAQAQDIRVVYTGGSMGIGSGQYHFALPQSLASALPDGAPKPESTTPFHGLLMQGPHAIAAIDGKVSSVVQFLKGPVTCEEPHDTYVLQTENERLFVPGSTNPDWSNDLQIEGATTAEGTIRYCSGSGHRTILMTQGGQSVPLPSWALTDFEFRLGLQLVLAEGAVRSKGYIIGIPQNEGARRFALLQSLLKESPGALYVDAGSFVDGNSSVRNDALSLHRPIGFEMLRRLSPAALVPGQTELAGGPTQFLAEARAENLPYVAANWKTDREDLVLPKFIEHTVETDKGLLTIAFIGVVDPTLHTHIHHLKAEGVTLSEPVSAVQQQVDALKSRGAAPNAIVLLSDGSPELIQEIRRSVTGLDLVLGDKGQTIQKLTEATWTLTAQNGRQNLPAAVPPMRDIMTADLQFDGAPESRHLAQISVRPQPIPESTLPDSAVRKRVTEIRATEYPLLDERLVPADPSNPIIPITQDKWSRVVCEAVREATSADVVLLAPLPKADDVPGALTELLTVDRLALRDRLEVHWIPGDRVNWLLLKLAGEIDVACGAPLGKKSSKTRGRAIEGQRLYRIVTTDRARETTSLGGMLKGAYSPFILDKPGYRTLHDEAHRPLTLRAAVLKTLRKLRDKSGPTENYLPALVARSPNDKPPMWLGRIRRLSLKLERFQGAEDDAYSSIPETKATAPSSLSLGTDIDAAIDYSSKSLLSDLRVRAAFTKLQVKDEDAQESADDLRVSSSISLPGMRIPLGKKLKFMPYGELLLDTEFTPAEEEETTLPRQADLSFALGFSAGRWGPLRRLRLGLLTQRDLAVSEKPLEWGARIEAETWVGFGPRMSWATTFDTNIFGNTPEDDESDLRFKMQIDSRISMPLARWLNVSIYGQAFLFQGRVTATEDVGSSFTAGLALDIVGVFEM